MSNRLRGIHLKLDRAEKHLEAIQELVRPFLYGKCEIIREKNMDTGFYELRLLLQEPDPILSTIIGDCLHNLRCALDYIVYQLVLAANKKPTTSNAFPIAETIAGWERHMKADRLCGVTPHVKTIIQGLQPYRFPEPKAHPLVRLNKLENIDKHRTLTITSVVAHDVEIRFGTSLHGVSISSLFGVNISPIVTANYRRNTIVARSPSQAILGGAMEMNGYAPAFVAFQDDAAKDVDVADMLADTLGDITGRVLPALTKFLT